MNSHRPALAQGRVPLSSSGLVGTERVCSDLAYKFRQARKVRMVTDVAIFPAPQDRIAPKQKHTRHQPGTPDRPADGVPLSYGLQGLHPDARSEELTEAYRSEAKSTVEDMVGIRDCTSLRPQFAEKLSSFSRGRRMKEQ